MFEAFQIGEGGVKATVFVATDIRTSLYISLAIFLGISLALLAYKRVF